jgi:hypothetical protein
MSQGYLVLAQGEYIKHAEHLAKSILATQSSVNKLSVITDAIDFDRSLFDQVIDIPEIDLANDKNWKIHNRVYFYDLTPYNETVILDADMLFLTDVSHWWNMFKNYDLLITDKVQTYRSKLVKKSPYRRAFYDNNLPETYSAFTYFKKSDTSKEFFDLLKIIIKNWKTFTEKFTPLYQQKFESIDLAMAIAVEILGIEQEVKSPFEFPTFTHMKSGCQDWTNHSFLEKWSDIIGFYETEIGKKIGPFYQSGILHYVDKDLI